MGFQTGTQVDPRLLDYSGYAQGMTQAAAITGAMLANIGKEIGEKREEQKQKKNVLISRTKKQCVKISVQKD